MVVRIDPRYFRPAEVETLLGDPSLAREKLGWTPTTSLEEMVEEMIDHDLEEARKEAYLKREGFKVVGRGNKRNHGDAPDPANRPFFCSRCPRHGRKRHRACPPSATATAILAQGRDLLTPSRRFNLLDDGLYANG